VCGRGWKIGRNLSQEAGETAEKKRPRSPATSSVSPDASKVQRVDTAAVRLGGGVHAGTGVFCFALSCGVPKKRSRLLQAVASRSCAWEGCDTHNDSRGKGSVKNRIPDDIPPGIARFVPGRDYLCTTHKFDLNNRMKVCFLELCVLGLTKIDTQDPLLALRDRVNELREELSGCTCLYVSMTRYHTD
jgi:hypothetical protein